MRRFAPETIDAAVSARLRSGESLYAVDETLLRSLDADLILTQDLCQVCAPSGNDVTRVLASLERKPEVLYFTPASLADVWDNLRTLGDASGTRAAADALIADALARLNAEFARASHSADDSAARVLRRVGRSGVLRRATGFRR